MLMSYNSARHHTERYETIKLGQEADGRHGLGLFQTILNN